MTEKTRRRVVAGLQIVLALLVSVGTWVALPARWLPLDAASVALTALLSTAAVALLVRPRWGRPLAVTAGWISLVTGTSGVTALALTAAHLSGLYGPIGSGGALLLASVAALVLPYLVGLPVIQLLLLREPK
jgi:hypothetical protein